MRVQPQVLPTNPQLPNVMEASVQTVVPEVKKAKARCWKGEVDTHATKDCVVLHYCYICDNHKHPMKKCPTIRLPKPSVFVAGLGNRETMFIMFPSSIYKEQSNPSPTALIS